MNAGASSYFPQVFSRCQARPFSVLKPSRPHRSHVSLGFRFQPRFGSLGFRPRTRISRTPLT
jgi:hypothetical protein